MDEGAGQQALCTARLVLRQWRESDLAPFARLNADPRVMEHFPSTLDRAASDAVATRIRDSIAQRGFGVWAVEIRGGANFIGFVGLTEPRFEAHFTPCVEIAWRLAHDHWGRGYATEAAEAALAYGFVRLGLEEIVAYAVKANARSRRVMDRLGMTYATGQDFDHPVLSEGHPLRRHVLYRLSRAAWRAGRASPEAPQSPRPR
ncbi:MAG: GNAT family N-acetyltransferase [Alphaproteobacteria bacterium]|nr:GNAT family N-acetyltransferase [Alphaproteobacteria bacterium]